MARLRYVKTPEQIAEAAKVLENLQSTVESLKAVYATDAALARAVLPKPLKPTKEPLVTTVISQVTIHLGGGIEFPLGAATFGVGAVHEGVEGVYQITMPMNNEVAVVSGRETYGEPKKLAEISLARDGAEVSGSVARMGMPYLELRGTVTKDLGPRKYTMLSYVFKALPSPDRTKGFDGDPLLVELEWNLDLTKVERVDGEVKLTDSPFDPVADLPVRKLISMEYETGSTVSGGRVLRAVPGEWLLPFLHQRYDDPLHPGVEIDV